MRELTREEKVAATFLDQGKRFPDPAKQRRFAVERTQSGLKCVQSYAETVVDRVLGLTANNAPEPPAEPVDTPEPPAVPEGSAIVDARLQQQPVAPAKKARKKAPAKRKLGKKKR